MSVFSADFRFSRQAAKHTFYYLFPLLFIVALLFPPLLLFVALHLGYRVKLFFEPVALIEVRPFKRPLQPLSLRSPPQSV